MNTSVKNLRNLIEVFLNLNMSLLQTANHIKPTGTFHIKYDNTTCMQLSWNNSDNNISKKYIWNYNRSRQKRGLYAKYVNILFMFSYDCQQLLERCYRLVTSIECLNSTQERVVMTVIEYIIGGLSRSTNFEINLKKMNMISFGSTINKSQIMK